MNNNAIESTNNIQLYQDRKNEVYKQQNNIEFFLNNNGKDYILYTHGIELLDYNNYYNNQIDEYNNYYVNHIVDSDIVDGDIVDSDNDEYNNYYVNEIVESDIDEYNNCFINYLSNIFNKIYNY
jgi:hypothetical protein